MRRALRVLALPAILGLAGQSLPLAMACTGVTVKAKDGAVIFARTLEFAVDLRSNVIVVPRGKEYIGTAPGGRPGHRWTTRYGFVGMNAFDLPVVADGLNDRGLHVGLFYFPSFAQYQDVPAGERDRALAPEEFGAYLLGSCADLDEATAAARAVKVGPAVFKPFGSVLPVHYIVTDPSGRSIVIEYVKGRLTLHDNPFGVMSNSPTFDWHMTNLSNYVNLTVSNVPRLGVSGKELKGLGQGSGMLGIPGDFTPPSRFVRAVAFSQSALTVATAREAVLQAFHILNQFDIPRGAARGVEHDKVVADYTLWTSAADLKNRRYFFRTFDNSKIRMIALASAGLGAGQVKTISIRDKEEIEDVTGSAK